AEHHLREVVDLEHRQDERHADRVGAGAEDVAQVEDATLFDVRGNDGVVDVAERVEVAEAHVEARAVTEFIDHGKPILHGPPEAAARARCQIASAARSISAASSMVRGTTLERSSHSSAEWSSPPIGPRPSRVGNPAAVVVFASLAPPVSVSCSSKPSSPAMAMASSAMRPLPGVRSIGGWKAARRSVAVIPSRAGWVTIPSTSAAATSNSAVLAARRSSSIRHDPATTFGRVPPS